jgi:hypothetical protein
MLAVLDARTLERNEAWFCLGQGAVVLHPSGLLSATVGEVRQLQHQLSSKSVRLGTKHLKSQGITSRIATHQATVPAKTTKFDYGGYLETSRFG